MRTAVSRFTELSILQRSVVILKDVLDELLAEIAALRVGSADVGKFFSIYAKIDGVWLVPAWLEGREVIAVFEDRADPKPSYIMWLEWRGGQISFIRDYRYVRYVVNDAELVLASDADTHGKAVCSTTFIP